MSEPKTRVDDIHDEISQVIHEIHDLMAPLVRAMEYEHRNVDVERLIVARIEQERAERNDRSFIAGLKCALRLTQPSGERYVARAFLSEAE